jgi:signal transduction histidine kinase
MDILIDSSNSWNLDTILSLNIQNQFSHSTVQPINNFFEGTYWIRIKITNNTRAYTEWILESYNYRINQLNLYLPTSKEKYLVKKTGDALPFYTKELEHKNLHFILNQPNVAPGYYYISYHSGSTAPFQFVIRSLRHFSAGVMYEYFSFGMYYGMLLIIGIYSFFLYLSFKDKALLFYLGYLFFTGLFSMCHDGLSFQFLWPEMPFMNNYVFIISVMCMTVFLFLYTCYLLGLPVKYPWVMKWAFIYIVVRLILYVICLIYFPYIRHLLYIDLVPFILSYAFAIHCYLKGHKTALYIIIGHSFIFIAYTFGLLRLFNVIIPSFFNVYTINMAVILDMLLLSLALGRRIRILKEKELINLQLEEKVKERAEVMMLQKDIIRNKIKELDTYIYRTAHDISGPLKSIHGLTNIGLLDPQQSATYFQHIQQTVIRMDEVVHDLYKISKINNLTILAQEVDFYSIYQKVIESLKNFSGFDKLQIHFELKQDKPIYSDESLLLIIFYNLIENAIQYRDQKRESVLLLHIEITENKSEILFQDNGIGIEEEYHEKIFQMFFRLDSEHRNTGLGLYSVKLAADKLFSTINIKESTRNGTSFILTLKDLNK